MKKLYYAEDDITIARSVQEYLYQQDYSTEIFPTIWQTKQALEKNVPDILLVDWNMPDGRGDELCRWARSRW